MQFAAPVAALYVPAMQAVGVLPSAPVNPASATHALEAVEPVAPPVFEFTAQSVQATAPVATL